MASIDLVSGTGVTFTVPRSACRLGHSSLSQLVYAHPQPSMGQTDSPVFVWSSLAGHFFGDESRSCSAVFVEHLYQIWLRQQHVGSLIAKIFFSLPWPSASKTELFSRRTCLAKLMWTHAVQYPKKVFQNKHRIIFKCILAGAVKFGVTGQTSHKLNHNSLCMICTCIASFFTGGQ